MSLDCYPFGQKQTFSLKEQPMALDVVYNGNLFVSVTDQCHTIVVFDLKQCKLIRSFSLGKSIVIDQIIHCNRGDYLACVGHKDGLLSIYTIWNWRQTVDGQIISEISVNVEAEDPGRSDKLNSIDCCQQTGNLAASCGDTILIYKYVVVVGSRHEKDDLSRNNSSGEVEVTSQDDADIGAIFDGSQQRFQHIISIKLTIWSLKVNLLENYLSIMASDHVQVLKLELLTLQIQSDGLDNDTHQESNGDSGSDPSNFTATPSETTSTLATSCSMISNSNSTTTTNFSSFNNNNNNNGEPLNNSDMSIITMNQQHQFDLESEFNADSNTSADDCITWNLNTKKLVKLPTLMHNTSMNLFSYHICHPLELLGPASESIACRVSAAIYSQDFCQNQLEAIVMLCKQFDSDREPVKSVHLQAVYLPPGEDLRRFNRASQGIDHSDGACDLAGGSSKEALGLLKSDSHELLETLTCYVTTLTHCFLYSLHGKKVSRTQTITHPDLCLDLRPDLLNVYLLTPLGLQICSTGVCDFTFRYDWSSSADLNLSFLATDRTRVLTSSDYVILVASSLSNHCEIEVLRKPDLLTLHKRLVYTVNRCNSISIRCNLLTYLHASALLDQFLSKSEMTDETCFAGNGNLLTEVTLLLCKQLLQKRQTNVITNGRIDKAIKHLMDISQCGLPELMSRLGAESSEDCREEEEEEMESCLEGSSGEGIDATRDEAANARVRTSNSECPTLVGGDLDEEDEEDEKPVDSDQELIKIYLKHAKFSQQLMDYLVSSEEAAMRKIINHMFEYNPRLLIRCGQRFPLEQSKRAEGILCLQLLIERLRLLAEYDSTGINRASVLFTLAILYNSLGERQKCLAALSQIKPLQHLAITMCSNYELSHSIANLVRLHYPDVFSLFLNQLAKRDKLAAQEFATTHGILSASSSFGVGGNLAGSVGGNRRTASQQATSSDAFRANRSSSAEMIGRAADEEARFGFHQETEGVERQAEVVVQKDGRCATPIGEANLERRTLAPDLILGSDSNSETMKESEQSAGRRAYLEAAIRLLESGHFSLKQVGDGLNS